MEVGHRQGMMANEHIAVGSISYEKIKLLSIYSLYWLIKIPFVRKRNADLK